MATPRADDLRLTPPRVTIGCPVRVSVTFLDGDGSDIRGNMTIVRQTTRERDTQHLNVDYEFRTKSRGRAWIDVSLPKPDVYWMSVQLTDDHGHRSHPAETALIVDGTRPWSQQQCAG
jgi:hypothetical protein